MPVVRGSILWAGEEYMLYGLESLATMAGYLVWGVLWFEALRVLSSKCMSCNEAVKC